MALKDQIIKLEKLLKSVITKKDLDHGEQSELIDFIEERFSLIDKEPKTLVDLSKKINVTGERIRQQESQAMRLLRKNPEMKKLRDFLRQKKTLFFYL